MLLPNPKRRDNIRIPVGFYLEKITLKSNEVLNDYEFFEELARSLLNQRA